MKREGKRLPYEVRSWAGLEQYGALLLLRASKALRWLTIVAGGRSPSDCAVMEGPYELSIWQSRQNSGNPAQRRAWRKLLHVLPLVSVWGAGGLGCRLFQEVPRF